MSKPLGERYTIAVDFDGVIHSYINPWVNPHTIPDLPVVGAIDWLSSISQKFDVVIFTTRARTWRGRRAIRKYLNSYGCLNVDKMKITDRKPAALIYIDDRAWRFEGTFPTSQQIHEARPWNKKKS
jgi:hypothetical protein